MGGENGKKYKKTKSGGIEVDGDFSVIVDPYLWKRFTKEEGQNFGLSFFFNGGEYYVRPCGLTLKTEFT